jgi:hypothetical protein
MMPTDLAPAQFDANLASGVLMPSETRMNAYA